MVSMINDRRFSVMQWAAFVCYGLPASMLPAQAAAELPAQARPKVGMGQLKMELEDLLGELNLSANKHTRPMPHVLQAALSWFEEQGYKSINEMLEATAPFTDVGVSKTSKFEITAAGQEFQLVEALALKRGPARILLKNLDLQRAAGAQDNMGQLKMELEDLLGELNLSANKHTRPMPQVKNLDLHRKGTQP